MADWIEITNFIVVVCGMTIASMGLFFSVAVPYLKKNDRIFLTVFFILLLFYTASDLTSQISLIFRTPPDFCLCQKPRFFWNPSFPLCACPFLPHTFLMRQEINRKRSFIMPFHLQYGFCILSSYATLRFQTASTISPRTISTTGELIIHSFCSLLFC